MSVFQPVKVENYEFISSGLNEYEPLLPYIKNDEEDGKIYLVKNQFDNKWRQQMDMNLNIQGQGRIMVNKSSGEIGIDVAVDDLENRIEKLEEGFRKLESKIEEESQEGEFYDLMGRIREINRGKEKIGIENRRKF